MQEPQKQIFQQILLKIYKCLDSATNNGHYLTGRDADRWVTLKKRSEGGSPRHIKIDEHGNIIGGAVPRTARGKPINSWWKKTENTSNAPKQEAQEQGTNVEKAEEKSSAKESNANPIGEEKPLTISTYYRPARGGSASYWGEEILEAVPDKEPGGIKLEYPTNKDWKDKTSKWSRTNYVDVTIKAGFHAGIPYNLDFDNITRVSGKTASLAPFFREKGFHWNGESWAKGDAEKPKSDISSSLPALSGSEKQIAWAERIRNDKLNEWKKKSDKAQKDYESIKATPEDNIQKLIKQYGQEAVTESINKWEKAAQNAKEKYEQALKQTKSSWWIDNR